MEKLILIVLLFCTVSGCRKGEDDPLFSLRSRTARLAGDWKLTSMERYQKSSDPNGPVNHISWIADGSEIVATYKSFGPNGESSEVIRRAFTTTYKFRKDGTYEMSEYTGKYEITNDWGTTVYDDSEIKVSGTWSFMAKNKSKDLKNKEALVLKPKIRTTRLGAETYTSNLNNQPEDVFSITELRNKKIVLKTQGELSFSASYSVESSEKIVLEQ